MPITIEYLEKPRKLRPDEVWNTGGFTNIIVTKAHEVDSDGWKHYAYRVKLTNDETGATMELPFRSGLANTEPPSAEDVLSCVISEANGYETSASVDEYAAEYGITAVTEALDTYRQVEQQSKELRRLLGSSYMDAVFPEYPEDMETVAARLVAA